MSMYINNVCVVRERPPAERPRKRDATRRADERVAYSNADGRTRGKRGHRPRGVAAVRHPERTERALRFSAFTAPV